MSDRSRIYIGVRCSHGSSSGAAVDSRVKKTDRERERENYSDRDRLMNTAGHGRDWIQLRRHGKTDCLTNCWLGARWHDRAAHGDALRLSLQLGSRLRTVNQFTYCSASAANCDINVRRMNDVKVIRRKAQRTAAAAAVCSSAVASSVILYSVASAYFTHPECQTRIRCQNVLDSSSSRSLSEAHDSQRMNSLWFSISITSPNSVWDIQLLCPHNLS